MLTTPQHYAYIKIAEGCNNFCAFCIIPHLRGRYRSRAVEDILQEARGLAESGVKELIVVAQDARRAFPSCCTSCAALRASTGSACTTSTPI